MGPLAALLLLGACFAVPRAHAGPPGDATSDGVVSVADAVAALRAATGLSGSCTLEQCDVDGSGALTVSDGVAIARNVAGLPGTPTAAARGALPTAIDVHFLLAATAALQGYHLEVTYPPAKGGFAGSADAVECTSSGDGIFIPNDRDDGTLALIQASAVPLAFPHTITCRFALQGAAVLEPADLGVTVVEVVENGAPGDPADLTVGVVVGDLPPRVCEDGHVALTTAPGGVLDAGWTGLGHGAPLPIGAAHRIPLSCAPEDPTCALDGTALAGAFAGPPLALSTGGVAVCVVNRFADAPTGTVACETGCATAQLTLDARVFLVQEASRPCPPCVGDVVANDGLKDGTCLDGATPGAACDAQGVHPLFDATGPDHGTPSVDCLPTGASVGELALTLDPLTTGAVALGTDEDCLVGGFPPGSCHCPGQILPNGCVDGICNTSGVCEHGPIDGVCDRQPFRHCRSEAGTADCDDVFPGAGTCVDVPRPCFSGPTIERTGVCGADEATMVAAFCLTPTRSAAVNVTWGLPGPAALSLPIRYGPPPAPTATVPATPGPTRTPGPASTSTPAPPPRPLGCSAGPLFPCAGFGAWTELVTLTERAAATKSLTWRWRGGATLAADDLGRPDVDTGYAVCAYASPVPGPTPDPPLLFEATIPAGSQCRDESCWRPTRGGGWIYRDAAGGNDGLTRLVLRPGVDRKAEILVRGHGRNLPLPALPLAASPIVQPQATNGSCWTSSFGLEDVRRNDATRFRAVSD
jgi:hypothetical protein